MQNNLKAERALLGCLIESESDRNLIPSCKEGFFQDEDEQIIFQAIHEMWHKSIDIDSVLLTQYIRKYKKFDMTHQIIAITNHYHIDNLIFAKEYFAICKERFAKRELFRMANQVKVMIKDQKDVSEISAYCEDKILGIVKDGDSDVKSMESVNKDFMERLDRKISKQEVQGLNTGYHNLDNILEGISPEELVVIAARPGMGKTSFACNIARNLASSGKRGIIFTYEMSPVNLSERMLSSLSGVSHTLLKRGEVSGDNFKSVMHYADAMSKMPLWYEDSFPSIDELKSKIMNYIHKYNIDFVVIDYLQLIGLPEGKKAYNKVDEIGQITRAFVKITMKYKIPILLLSQLSRGLESRESKRPLLSDLRDSGTIEQDAHKVIFLWNDKPDYNANNWEMKVFVAKNRNGGTGETQLTFNRPTLNFV